MMQLEYMISVMQAARNGGHIQCRRIGTPSWLPVPEPTWNWEVYEYRVRPEPREWWLLDHLAYPSRTDALRGRAERDWDSTEIIHVREVQE